MQSRRGARLALVLAVAMATLGIAGGASAASVSGTIRLDPATIQVGNGGTFNVKVISNAAIPISGVSASITFNRSVLQVTTITRSSAWASAPFFIAGDATAIATANSKGVLQNVAVSFLPPGNVPAGDQQFITVGFKATACGTVAMTVPTGRVDSSMLDGRAATYGAAMKVTTTGATVTVCQGGGGASGSPGASAGASDQPSGSIDPNASPSAAPTDSTQPGASSGPSASPSGPAPTDNSGGSGSGNGSSSGGGTSSDQNTWLTFALAALAVSAAGLALLILVLTIVAIVAASVGAVFVIRLWRRYSANGTSAPAPGTPEAPADGAGPPPTPTNEAGDGTTKPQDEAPPAPDPLADAPEPPSGRASMSPYKTGK